jgi:hypothetical protein
MEPFRAGGWATTPVRLQERKLDWKSRPFAGVAHAASLSPTERAPPPGETIDEAAFKALIREAVSLNQAR